jgi:polysaccharide export outer membrane protein
VQLAVVICSVIHKEMDVTAKSSLGSQAIGSSWDEEDAKSGIRECFMRCLVVSLLAVLFALTASAQQQATANRGADGIPSFRDGSNLPAEKIGPNDLIGLTVHNEPDLTRTVRVGADGDIRLPMLMNHIHAAGLNPDQLETAIAKALTDEEVVIDPIVTVSVVEYRSRPISVSGAVKRPVTFQASGDVTLLDAIAQAEGLADNAGAEILVSKKSSATNGDRTLLVKRIPVHGLLDGEDPALNLTLDGGEDIRVPEAGRVFVLGRVKKAGSFFITDGSESSVLKALAMSDGLDTFPSTKAYIYRVEGGIGGRNEIPIELKRILDRKSPDVPLLANDILYIPDATGVRASLKVLETSIGIAAGLGGALIYTLH